MTDATQQQLISDIAHEVITEIAPRELPLFRVTSETFFDTRNRGRVSEGRKPTDEMLGFGLDTVTIFLTPVVLAVTTEVVTFLMEKVKESLKELSRELVTTFIKEVIKRIAPTEERNKKTPLAFSPEELVELRQLMHETAMQLRLPKEQTELLVHAMVGKLAIAKR